MNIFVRAVAAVAVVLGMAGCSAPADVEALVQTEIAEAVPGAGPVTCPDGDPAAEVGSTLRCEFQVAGQPVDAVATVTSVDGGTPTYSITAEARPVAKALLDQKIAEQIGQQTGTAIERADCAGDLPAQLGGTVRCVVTGAGRTIDVDVTVTAIDGSGLIQYSLDLVR